MTTQQFVEFDSIDDIVQIVDARFENAHHHMFEIEREQMIDELNIQFENEIRNRTKLIANFDALHASIERNLRVHIAREYVYILNMQNDANYAIDITDSTFHNFVVVDVERNVALGAFVVNDDLSIRIVTQ